MRQALELALEALERSVATCFDQRSHDEVMGRPEHFVNQAITAIKEALAQPEQEPVATLDDLEQEIYENTRQFVSRDVMEWMLKRYYTTPPQRKPLTDEMIVAGGKALAKRHADSCGLDFDDVWKYYAGEHKDDAKAAIEAAHGIKE